MRPLPSSSSYSSLVPKVWYDNRASDLTKDGMLKGIEQAAAFILFLSVGVLERPYCQLEIRHAIKLKKPIILLHGERRAAHAVESPRSDLFDTLRFVFRLVQSPTPATAPSTSAPPTLPRPSTCRSCSISTSPCPSGGAATSAMGC